MWSRHHLTPLLQAEEDRDQVRRHYADKAREKELLGTDLKIYNSDRYVELTAELGLLDPGSGTDTDCALPASFALLTPIPPPTLLNKHLDHVTVTLSDLVPPLPLSRFTLYDVGVLGCLIV